MFAWLEKFAPKRDVGAPSPIMHTIALQPLAYRVVRARHRHRQAAQLRQIGYGRVSGLGGQVAGGLTADRAGRITAKQADSVRPPVRRVMPCPSRS